MGALAIAGLGRVLAPVAADWSATTGPANPAAARRGHCGQHPHGHTSGTERGRW